MKPRYAIPAILATVLAVFLMLSDIRESLKERTDPYLLLFIGVTFTCCMVITLIYTRSWTIRSAGVLLTMAGDGVLYSFAGSESFLSLSPAVIQHTVDLARACFIVGAPLMLIGLVLWLWRVRDPPPEPLEADSTRPV